MEDKTQKDYLPLSMLVSAIVIAGAWVYTSTVNNTKGTPQEKEDMQALQEIPLRERVLPAQGVELQVSWGNLGMQMVQAGVIDAQKFEELSQYRGGMTQETKQLLYGQDNGNLMITPQNADTLLNMLWALGLGNKNDILEKGEMADPRYGRAGRFASTGGWTLSQGNAMDHYSKHSFIVLTPDQQDLVDRVSKNIYRPCCNNPVHFPDCNHGMAMLGLLELMASQGVQEEEMYRVALQVNSYWFPDTYLTIAEYLDSKGKKWEDEEAREILGVEYSSGSGYRKIMDQMTGPSKKNEGSCGV